MTLQDALKVNGKARLPHFADHTWVTIRNISGELFVLDQKDRYFSNIGQILRDDWQPYKEPCKHEPKLISQIVAIPFGGIRESDLYLLECKHCGVKIKAEKWVEE